MLFMKLPSRHQKAHISSAIALPSRDKPVDFKELFGRLSPRESGHRLRGLDFEKGRTDNEEQQTERG
jgi:hypothetical protein